MSWFDAIFDTIREVFDRVINVFGRITHFFNWIIDVADYIRKLIMCYIPSLFGWLRAYLDCGVAKIGTFLDCFFYYGLEVFGKIIYLPVALIFYFSDSTDLEQSLWGSIESIDQEINTSTGYHICHYSDSIQTKCYKCNIPKLKKPPIWPVF